MSSIDEINQKIFYAEGPQGQRVVVATPRKTTTERDRTVDQCYCCMAIGIFMATLTFLLGGVYTGVTNAISRKLDVEKDGLAIAGIVLLVLAALFIGAVYICWRSILKIKGKRVLKYMHEDASDVMRAIERQERSYRQL